MQLRTKVLYCWAARLFLARQCEHAPLETQEFLLGDASSGFSRRFAFEQAPYAQDVEEVLHRHGTDYNRSVCLPLQELLPFKTSNCLTQWCARDTKLFSDAPLHDHIVGSHFSRKENAQQTFVSFVGQRMQVRRFSWRGNGFPSATRSEERRVGKECRSRWS